MKQAINDLIDIYQSKENDQINYKIKFKNLYFNNDFDRLYEFLKNIKYAYSLSFIKTDIKNENFEQICKSLENNNSIIELKLKNNLWLNNIFPIKNVMKNNTLETINFNFYAQPWQNIDPCHYESIDDIFNSLTENSSLNSIKISIKSNNVSINLPHFNSIEKNNTLENLSISGFKIKDNISKILNANNSIKMLKLQNSDIQIDTLQPLIQKNSLYSLNVLHSNINNIQNLLLNNTSIVYLNLSFCNLFNINDIVPFIQNNPSLSKLNLSNNCFKNIDPLYDALKNNNSIYKLNLSNNNIANINNFSKIFETNEYLQILYLSHNNISDVRVLSDKLKNNISLTKLDLSFNQINNSQFLFNSLKNNSSLTKLNLKSNRIYCIDNLNEILSLNKTLTSLNLLNNSYNYNSLIETLYNNDTLTSFYITFNEYDDPQKISSLLKSNTTLTKLSINYNTNNFDNFLKFSEGLKTNSTLTKLNLYNNTNINYHNPGMRRDLSKNSIKRLTDALIINKTINTLKMKNFFYINNELNLSCLADLIKNNKSLTTINIPTLEHYKIDMFAEALKLNSTLTKL